MKLTITETDVRTLTGKFIVQINSDEPDTVISEKNWSFMQEKRISFICGLKLIGFFYEHKEFKDAKEFVEYFNNYVKGSAERFHRLLTSKELDFLNKKLKEENY